MSIYGTWADVEKDLVKINAQAKIIKSPKSGRNIRSLNYSFRNRQGLQSRLTETGIEVESLITDPPANSNGTITEVRVPGNVSGILIPNSNFIIVRVLASTSANGEPLDQDLRFLRWKTVYLILM